MNWPRLFLLCALCVPMLGYAQSDGDARAPDWELKTPAGKTIHFYEDSDDEVAVVFFWASWCPYCRKLMPELEAIKDHFGAEHVHYYALNIWDDADSEQYARGRNFSFTLLLDAEEVAGTYGIKGTPGLFVIAPDKRIVWSRSSGQSADKVKAQASQAIGELLAPH